MTRVSLARCLAGVLLAALAAARVDAQIGAGTLRGTVADAAGAALPGAAVTVSDAITTTTRAAVTDEDGAYAIPALRPGRYTVSIALQGFRLLRREGVQLATGETVRLDVRLQVGGLSDTVTVMADAPLLRGETAGLGQVVDSRKVAALPLNGRSFITLAALAPGVALPPGSSLPRINGGRPRTNEYLFDGISVLQPEPGQVAFFPNVDAIQEFKIESNSPSAEFGRFNGGVVNLTTKAGANELRGTAFEFFRHEALNARNAFATGAVKPRFRRHQFGGVAGGPVAARPHVLLRRLPGAAADDRTHGDLDGADRAAAAGHLHRGDRRPRAGHLRPGNHFTDGVATTRQPFPGNAVPADRFDTVAHALLARYPLPTSAGTANNFRRLADEDVDQDQFERAARPPRRRCGSRVRARDAIRRVVRAGHATTRRQRRGRRHAGTAGDACMVGRLALPADFSTAWSTSCASATRGGRCSGRRRAPADRPRARSASRAFRRTRTSPTPCRRSSSPAISSSARHRTRRLTSARA